MLSGSRPLEDNCCCLGEKGGGGGVSWVMEGLLWVAVVVALSADLFLVELCVNRVRLIELPVRKAKA